MKSIYFASSFWDDDFIFDLSITAKLFYIFLITNKNVSPSGLYKLGKIEKLKAGLTQAQINKAFQELNGKVYVFGEWIFIKNLLFKSFLDNSTEEKFLKSNIFTMIKDQFSKNSFSPELIEIFLKTYPFFAPYKPLISPLLAPYKGGGGTLLHTDTDTDTDTDTEKDIEKDIAQRDKKTSLQAEASQPEIILSIPLIKRDGEFRIYQPDINQWQDTFPGVDVRQKLREIRQWNIDNPTNRKTKSGICKHISVWLSGEQNKMGNYKQPQKKDWNVKEKLAQAERFLNQEGEYSDEDQTN